MAGDNITNVDAGIKDYSSRALLAIQRFEVSASINGTTAIIRWQTANEVNTSRFIVERSVDNNLFIAVGEKAAAGNNSGISNYSYHDDLSSLTAYPIIYYRVKLVDIDGRSVYSKVVLVRMNDQATVKIWPNPFADKVSIFLVSPVATIMQVRLIDYAGKTINISNYNVVKGINQLYISGMGNLPKGIYTMMLNDDTGNINYAEKLIRQ